MRLDITPHVWRGVIDHHHVDVDAVYTASLSTSTHVATSSAWPNGQTYHVCDHHVFIMDANHRQCRN